jgi:hypothetical protein
MRILRPFEGKVRGKIRDELARKPTITIMTAPKEAALRRNAQGEAAPGYSRCEETFAHGAYPAEKRACDVVRKA